MFFLEFHKEFWNSYVKEQSNFHLVGILEEMDRLLIHFLIDFLKLLRDWHSIGTISHIFGPRYEIPSVP